MGSITYPISVGDDATGLGTGFIVRVCFGVLVTGLIFVCVRGLTGC